MGKIYEDGEKLTVEQVCDRLNGALTREQAMIMNHSLADNHRDTPRETLSHTILDAYKSMPSNTADEINVKKYCKFLMDKYMKGMGNGTVLDGVSKAYQSVIDTIINKATES